MEMKITICDVCNPQQNLKGRRGYCMWPVKVSIQEFGWKKKCDNNGNWIHICPECQEEGLIKDVKGMV